MNKLNIKEQLQGLINQAPATPVQRVNPVREDKGYHCNFWIDSALEKQLKQYALDHSMSIKEVCETALRNYLER